MDDALQVIYFIPYQLSIWYQNLTHNIVHMWDGMTATKYIRLIAIAGAYLLLRPYLQKIQEKLQGKQHEKELDPYETEKQKPKLSPNALRGVGGKPVEIRDSDEEGDVEGDAEGAATNVNWGKKARKRQRQVVRKVLEAEEMRRMEEQEDDEDKDIREYLVDYVPGEDGW